MIVAIVACDNQWGIGKDGSIPWKCKEDLKHFRETTNGHKIVMGRKTWESLPIRPLPDRVNVVITRQTDYIAEGAIISDDIIWPDDEDDILYVIGGSEIYKLYEPYLDKILITRIPNDHECDTFLDFKDQWVSIENGIEIADGIKVETYIRNEK